MEIVLAIHSIVRWLILLVAVVALVKLGWGWRRGGEFDGLDRGVVAGYSGLLDLQALLGLILLFGNPIFRGEAIQMAWVLHAIVMILAVVAGHLPAMWRQAPAPQRYRNTLAALAGSLGLIIVGIVIIAMAA